jgi:DNA-binding HxlR family transcriptional regulator
MATREMIGRARAARTVAKAAPEPEKDQPPPCHGPAARRLREMLTRVGDKWSVHVIVVLGGGRTLRFSELQRSVEGISQRMLTVTLRSLERDGLVKRTMHPEVPPRVEYALTPLGRTLLDTMKALLAWTTSHIEEVDAARARYDAQPPRATW